MHGSVAAVTALQKADLIVALGPVSTTGSPAGRQLRAVREDRACGHRSGGVESSIDRERVFVADAGDELRISLAILRGELELGLGLTAIMTMRGRQCARRSRRRIACSGSPMICSSLLACTPLSSRLIEQVDVAELMNRLRRARRQPGGDGRQADLGSREPRLATLTLDPKRMETAVGNLIENALIHGAGEIAIQAERDGDELEVVVRDDGPGFPVGFAQRAFDRFARGEAARTSSGTGLAPRSIVLGRS